MFKLLLTIIILSCNFAFAAESFKKFDIIELKNEPKKEGDSTSPKKGKMNKRYAIVLSGDGYNSTGKSLLVAPVILKSKDYKGRFVHEVKNGGKDYIIFIDKLRSIPKSKSEKVLFKLKESDKKTVEEKFNVVLK